MSVCTNKAGAAAGGRRPLSANDTGSRWPDLSEPHTDQHCAAGCDVFDAVRLWEPEHRPVHGFGYLAGDTLSSASSANRQGLQGNSVEESESL
jgi:hypothetical protein